MKRHLMVAGIALCAGLLASNNVQAQSLGGVLKKAKKAVEKVADTELYKKKTDKKDVTVQRAQSMYLSNGISMTNPLSEYLTVENIELYGIPTSENTGNVYMTMKVCNKLPEVASVLFGSSTDDRNKMIAVDAAGKVYNVDAYGGFRFDTPVDVPVVVQLSEPALQFLNVARNLDKLDMVKINVFMDATHRGNIVLKNLPITWLEPEKE